MAEPININKNQEGTFGPEDELDEEQLKNAKREALIAISESGALDMEQNLEKDPQYLRIKGQEYVYMSFIGPYPSLRAKHDKLQMNICGVKGLTSLPEKPKYDIFLFEMYAWICVPPNPKLMENQENHDKFLHKLITNYKYDIELQKSIFNKRKELMQNNPDPNKVIEEIEDDEEDEEEEPIENQPQSLPELPQSSKNPSQFTDPTQSTNYSEFASAENIVSNENLGGYKYAIINIVGTEDTGYAVKIKGIFQEYEDAKKAAEGFSEYEHYFEHYIIDINHWVPLDITPHDLDEQIFPDKDMNLLYQEHKKHQEKVQSAKPDIERQYKKLKGKPSLSAEIITE